MEEYRHFFGCGVEMKIEHDEDGYTVNFDGVGYAPLTDFFTDFKNLLYGIKDAIQSYSDTKTEIETIAFELDCNFDTGIEYDEMEEILLNV